MTGERRDPLGRDACERIADAIQRAEATTSAEIVVLVAARAGLYRSAPLLLALACGLVLPWPLILLTAWSAASIALAQALVVVALLIGFAHPWIRLRLVPRSIRRARAHEAALREFAIRGLTATPGRTGVLIYLAQAEGHVEIVADRGVALRIPAQVWSDTIDRLLQALRQGEMERGLIRAVEDVGGILMRELPPGPEPANALPNRVILLD